MDNAHIFKRQEPESQGSSSTIGQMEEKFKRFTIIPRTEFEHRTALIDTSRLSSKPLITEIIVKEIELANIKDDQLLRIYQLQLQNILEYHDMGLWDSVGQVLFAKLLGDLGLSRSRGGSERMYQAGAIPDIQQGVSGIGEFFKSKEQKEREAQAQRNKSLLTRYNDNGESTY